MNTEQLAILLGGLGIAAFGAFQVRNRAASAAVQIGGVGLAAYALLAKPNEKKRGV